MAQVLRFKSCALRSVLVNTLWPNVMSRGDMRPVATLRPSQLLRVAEGSVVAVCCVLWWRCGVGRAEPGPRAAWLALETATASENVLTVPSESLAPHIPVLGDP